MKEIRIATFLLALSTAMFSTSGFAQCVANAGIDTTLCIEQGLDNYFLGGNPTAVGGTAPYVFAWTCTIDTGFLIFTADDFLDDPSSPNPQLIDFFDGSLVFHLTVTDALGLECTDSVTIHFCQFLMTLEDKRATINSGDTIQLYSGLWNNCEPLIYQWTPDYNISDPSAPFPSVWPEVSTNYVATVTNSAGCTAVDETFEVTVNPLGIFQRAQNSIDLKIYPHPIESTATIELENALAHRYQIYFYDATGRLVKEMDLKKDRTAINGDEFNSGMYFYRVTDKNTSVHQGKIIFD